MRIINKATVAVAAAAFAFAAAGATAADGEINSLEGTWIMDSAYEIRADRVRVTNFGEHPSGLMMVDAAGRYSIQIFRIGRSKFASGDKKSGAPEEYREAALGSSTHFGLVEIDREKRQLTFKVEAASYPNWEGKSQIRDFDYSDGLLSYAVPASASGDGTIAYSVWRRASEESER